MFKNIKIIILSVLAALSLIVFIFLPSKDKVGEIKLDKSEEYSIKKIKVDSYDVSSGEVVIKPIEIDEDTEINIAKHLIEVAIQSSQEDINVKLENIYFGEEKIYLVFDSEIQSVVLKNAMENIIRQIFGIENLEYLVIKNK